MTRFFVVCAFCCRAVLAGRETSMASPVLVATAFRLYDSVVEPSTDSSLSKVRAFGLDARQGHLGLMPITIHASSTHENGPRPSSHTHDTRRDSQQVSSTRIADPGSCPGSDDADISLRRDCPPPSAASSEAWSEVCVVYMYSISSVDI